MFERTKVGVLIKWELIRLFCAVHRQFSSIRHGNSGHMSLTLRSANATARNKFLFSREALDCIKRVFDANSTNNTCNLATFINAVVDDDALSIIVGPVRSNQIVAAISDLDHSKSYSEYITYSMLLQRLHIETPIRPVTPHPSPYQLSLAEFRQRLQNIMKSDYTAPVSVPPPAPSHSTFKQIAERLERLAAILTPDVNVDEVTNRIGKRMEEEKMDIADDNESNRQAKLLQDRLYTLTPEEERVVTNIFSPPYNNSIIIDKFNIDMNKNKLRCLVPSTWLNDEVINFYMCMLQERDNALVAAYPNRRSSHYFNSFFVHKLVDADNGYRYNNIKRWTKKFDVFEKEKIFFPINIHNTHWTLAVAYVQQRAITYYDSMGGAGTHYTSALVKFFVDEAKSRKGIDMKENEWSVGPSQRSTTPQQNNGVDCGVFTILFADYLTDNLPLEFSQNQIDDFRKRIAAAIARGSLNYSI